MLQQLEKCVAADDAYDIGGGLTGWGAAARLATEGGILAESLGKVGQRRLSYTVKRMLVALKAQSSRAAT